MRARGEGILPSLAPTGAHGGTLEPMRLAAHSEGKMPSPQGPSGTKPAPER